MCISHSASFVYIGEPQGPPAYVIGDLGFMDENGFLRITRREENVLITLSGPNISAESPECERLPQSEIAPCLVVGDGASFPAAWLGPTAEQEEAVMLQRWQTRPMRGYQKMHRDKKWQRPGFLPCQKDSLRVRIA